MRIVGIDTSLTSTGVAVIENSSSPVTYRVESKPPKRAKGDKTPPTLMERRDRIASIVARILSHVLDTPYPAKGWRGIPKRPALAVIEGPAYSASGAGTWDRAWLWGSVVFALADAGVPVAVCPPTVRAKWATGSGAAGKNPVAVHLSRMWPAVDPNISDDQWDALSLASIGAQRLDLIPCELTRHTEQLAKVAWPADLNPLEAAA